MAESISDCCLDIIRSYLVHVYSRHNVWLLVVFSLKGSESVCVCVTARIDNDSQGQATHCLLLLEANPTSMSPRCVHVAFPVC